MPSCREFDALVTPYIDGEATAAERAVVESHLAACPPCRHRAAAETAARETLRARLCRPCAPDQLRARCLAAAALEKGSGWLSRTRHARLIASPHRMRSESPWITEPGNCRPGGFTTA